MAGSCARTALTFLLFCVCLELPAWPQRDQRRIQAEYAAAQSELQKHLQFDQWLDGEPGTPALLARYWALSREWVTAWMDAHPAEGLEGVKKALAELVPSDPAQSVPLDKDSVLVQAPGAIGNVFIVTRANGLHRVAWSIDRAGDRRGQFSEGLDKWRVESAGSSDGSKRRSGEGPNGPLVPAFGVLPQDRQGRARFYIDAAYAQSAGGSGTKQISLWIWDGQAARALIVRDYRVSWFQSKFTRLERDVLKVHEKRQFRMLSSCAGCEERQTDWMLRVTPDGVVDLGAVSTVPELDAVDELFYRLTHAQATAGVASEGAVAAAQELLRRPGPANLEVDAEQKLSLGMIVSSSVTHEGATARVCLATLGLDGSVYRLKAVGEKYVVTEINKAPGDCAR